MSLKDYPTNSKPRLIATWLSKKPRANSLVVTIMTFVIMALISQIYWTDFLGLSDLLYANKILVYTNHEYWRLFSAVFIHSDYNHFLSNMYMLCIFVFFTYGYTNGSIYPWLSVILAGVVNAVAIWTYPDQVRLLGASGLVYLLGGTWLTLFFLIQRQYNFFSRTLRVSGIAAVILFPTTFTPSTSYRTHFFGFIAGIFMGLIFFIAEKKRIRSAERYSQPEPEDSAQETLGSSGSSSNSNSRSSLWH
jgi:rhomboid protease GluP